jgi:hypothetical protein
MVIPTVHFLNANDAATCGNPNAQYGTADRKTFNDALSQCGRCRSILEKQKRNTPKPAILTAQAGDEGTGGR